MAAVSFKQVRLAEEWDAIVIGSGIGGLAAAVLLSRHGKRVLVLERHTTAGGFTHTFRRPGYEWDVGLHYVGQVQEKDSSIRRMFDQVTEGSVCWQAMPDVYDRFDFAGQSFSISAGLEKYRENLRAWFPSDVTAIDGYISAVQSCNRASGLYFAERAIPAPAAALAGGWMRSSYLRWARRTTGEVLSSLTGNRELAGVLAAQWGDYGLPPAKSSFAVHAMIAEHYFAGGNYPVGGASNVAKSMIPLIERQGGCVVIGAEVATVLLEGNRAIGVRMADGSEFKSRLVVSDAGAGNTFGNLLPPDLPALQLIRDQLKTLSPSPAHICLYIGLSKPDSELGLTGTNIWSYPSFDHDANMQRFTEDMEAPFPCVFLSFPSAKDPEFQSRYPGHSTIEAISLIPYEGFARWADTRWRRRGEDYDALKERLAARLRAEVERQLPAVEGSIAVAELSTPVTTRHFANYQRGEIYGIAATPARYELRGLGARTPIRGLYLAGQDACTLGVTGALVGGFLAASAALGRNLIPGSH